MLKRFPKSCLEEGIAQLGNAQQTQASFAPVLNTLDEIGYINLCWYHFFSWLLAQNNWFWLWWCGRLSDSCTHRLYSHCLNWSSWQFCCHSLNRFDRGGGRSTVGMRNLEVFLVVTYNYSNYQRECLHSINPSDNFKVVQGNR